MPSYLVDYYKQLQNYFSLVKQLNTTCSNAFDQVINQAFSPRAVSINDYTENNEKISFDLRRVCRLTNTYVFYLYKLFLEYRGRQPFETINLSRCQSLTVVVDKQGEEIEFEILAIIDPLKDGIHLSPWIIEKDELNRVLQALEYDGHVKEQVYLLNIDSNIGLSNGRKVCIKKMKSGKAKFTLSS